jgi:transposase
LDTNFWGFSLAKYSEEFKLRAVKRCLSGAIGPGSLAMELEVSSGQLKRWIAAFRIHGKAGLTKKFSHYGADFRLKVLQHMWRHSLSFNETAAVFNIRSPGSIGVWERCYHDGGIDALRPRKRGRSPNMTAVPPSKKQPTSIDAERSRDDLLAEVNQLRMENAFLKKLQALVQSQKAATTRKKRK